MANSRLTDLLNRNTTFASTYPGVPPLSAVRQRAAQSANSTGSTVILCCADPRFPPERFLSLQATDGVAVIRNAGGRATPDVIRSLLALNALVRVGLVLVMHHTDCGMTHVTDEEIRVATRKFGGGGSEEKRREVDGMTFGAFGKEEVEESVREDVMAIRGDGVFGGSGARVVGLVLNWETGVIKVVDDEEGQQER